MEPAQSIIRVLGGPSAIAQQLGIHRTRVSSWQRSRATGGTGGTIPQKYHRELLARAKALGVELQPDAFLPVAEAAA